MRFLRILPAVWAIISWSPVSSFTRKVAFGSSSLTVPGNSNSSSFAIPPHKFGRRALQRHGQPLVSRLMGAFRAKPWIYATRQRASSPERRGLAETAANPCGQGVARFAVGLQHRVPGPQGQGWVLCRPILDVDRVVPRQLDGAVLRLRGQRNDQVERPLLQVGEGLRAVAAEVGPKLV